MLYVFVFYSRLLFVGFYRGLIILRIIRVFDNVMIFFLRDREMTVMTMRELKRRDRETELIKKHVAEFNVLMGLAHQPNTRVHVNDTEIFEALSRNEYA